MNPAELNETSDELLLELIRDALATGITADRVDADCRRLAPFVTGLLLLRINNHVVDLIDCGECKLAFHKAIGLVVVRVAGFLPPASLEEAETIGNRAQVFMNGSYLAHQKRIKRNVRNKASKEKQLADLDLKCWGGVPGVLELTIPDPNAPASSDLPGDSPHSQAADRQRRVFVPSTVPRLRDSEVGRWHVTDADDLQVQAEKIVELTQKTTNAARTQERCCAAQALARVSEAQLHVHKEAATTAAKSARLSSLQAQEEQALRQASEARELERAEALRVASGE
eukprot:1677250-Prymnesium_polylepis.2